MTTPRPTFESLLCQFDALLYRLLHRHSTDLRRFESIEDLAQGVRLRALEHAITFEYRSDAEFVVWLKAVIRSHLATRREYWQARKRQAGLVLHLSSHDSTLDALAVNPEGVTATPSSFLERKEQLDIAMQALEQLLPRDQELIRGWTVDQPLSEVATTFHLTRAAAQRARLRALERFRAVFELLYRGRRAPQR